MLAISTVTPCKTEPYRSLNRRVGEKYIWLPDPWFNLKSRTQNRTWRHLKFPTFGHLIFLDQYSFYLRSIKQGIFLLLIQRRSD